MKQIRLTFILTALVAMLATVVVGTSEAQSPQKGSPGLLILNGELIEGPYDIAIEDSSININGLGIDRSPTPLKVITLDPSAVARHQVYEAFWAGFRRWVAEEGLETARQRALEFMQAQSIVEKAYLESQSNLQVLFRGEKYEVTVSLEPPWESPLSPEEARQQLLEDRVESLRYWLTHGCLVILNEGVLMVTPPSEGEATLKKLQDIVATKVDPEERLSAIHGIIPDKAMAKAIAEQLGQ